MRLVTLNAWSGRALLPLMAFFQKYGGQTDIFCLQEVCNCSQEAADLRHPDQHPYGPLFDRISDELPKFSGSFAEFKDDPNKKSLASFCHESVHLRSIDDFVLYRPERSQETDKEVLKARKLQYLVVEADGKEVLVANYHGIWNNGPKTDTPERIEQSKKIRKFLDQYPGPKILCGDFNLLPETESMRILEEGMRNLIKDYRVQSTRTSLYRHYHDQDEPNFADYILISPEIVDEKFEVLPDIASDHAALYLEFKV